MAQMYWKILPVWLKIQAFNHHFDNGIKTDVTYRRFFIPDNFIPRLLQVFWLINIGVVHQA